MKRITSLLSLILILTINLQAFNQENSDVISIIDSLNDLSDYHVRQIQIDSSYYYAREALKLSEPIKYSAGIANAKLYMAQSLFHHGSFEQALKSIEQAENERHTKKTPLLRFEVSRVKGRIYSNLGLDSKAITIFKQSLRYASALERPDYQNYCYSLIYENLAFVYSKLGETDSVRHYLFINKDMLEDMEESFVFYNLLNVYTSLGEYFIKDYDYHAAVENLKKAENLAESYQFPYLSRNYMFRADAEYMRDSLDLALRYYNKALENLEETQLKGEYPLLYEKISKLYELKGDYTLSKEYITKRNEISQELSDEKISSVSYAVELMLREDERLAAEKTRNRIVLSSIAFSILLILACVLWRNSRRRIQKRHNLETLHLKRNKQEIYDEVLALAKKDSPLFIARFTEVFPEFVEGLTDLHPDLTQSELSFCAMMYLNLSTKEIAKYTFITVRSVQTKRSRLRKKMGLESDVDMYQYIRDLAVELRLKD